MTPIQAAAVQWGETVNISGFVAPIRTLFQSSVLQSEQLSTADDRKPGNMWYGFTASGPATLLARWNQAGIQFYRGEPLPAKTVTSAFK